MGKSDLILDSRGSHGCVELLHPGLIVQADEAQAQQDAKLAEMVGILGKIKASTWSSADWLRHCSKRDHTWELRAMKVDLEPHDAVRLNYTTFTSYLALKGRSRLHFEVSSGRPVSPLPDPHEIHEARCT